MAEVVWEADALVLRQYVLLYGELKFGKSSANKLNNKFKEYSRLLASNPRIGKRVNIEGLEKHEVRSVLAHQCYRLYYVVEEDKDRKVVRIIDLVDTRSNPESLSERLINTLVLQKGK